MIGVARAEGQTVPVQRLAEMTWTEVRDLDRAAAAAVLPIGACEAHGPHLPLSADVIIAEATAEAGAVALAAAGRAAVVLPALVYTSAPFAAAFPGTLPADPARVTGLVVDIARGLTAQGFGVLALANAHLDPSHLACLHAAVAECARDALLPVAFPDLTRRPWALRLGDEFRTGACHAGRYETSLVLAARPDLVREEARRALPPNPASLSVAIRDGKGSFAAAGGPDAYFGWPADATAREGTELLATLGAILAEAVAAVAGSARP